MSFRLDGKIALITAAAQGIGAASARIMAQQGATVVLADRNEEGAQQAAEQINVDGGSATALRFDALSKDSVTEMVRRTHERHGRLDILHNNAGGTDPMRDKQALDVDDDTWLEIFDFNIHQVHWATRTAIAYMLDNGGGSIVNTVTGGAAVAYSTHTAYGTSKGALASYTRYIAVQYGRRGIRCNGISPGLILTPHAMEAMSEEFQDELFGQMTTTRVGVPDDIGHLAAFLASDASGYINGLIIPVDGGGTARAAHDAGVLAIGGYGPGHPAPTENPTMPTD